MATKFEPDGVVDMDQIGTGFLWNFDRIEEQKQWDAWYNGKLGSLLANPDLFNGLTLVPATSLIVINLAKLCSNYYLDATWGIPALMSAEDEALARWLDDMRPALHKAFGNAILFSQVEGDIILQTRTTSDGPKIRAIKPHEFVIVKDPTDDEVDIGYVIMYEWDSELYKSMNVRITRPTRMRRIRYAPDLGINDVTDFNYAGGVIGEQLGPPQPGDTTGIFVAAEGQSFYREIAPLWLTFMVRMTLANKNLNQHANPPLMLPSSILTERVFQAEGNEKTDRGDELVSAQFTNGRDIVGFVDDDASFIGEYIGFDSSVSISMEFLQYIATLIYMITGVPPSSFGVNVGLNESGEARKTAMMRAVQRVNTIHNGIERVTPMILKAMGAPEGDVTFTWSSNFVENEGDRVDNLIKLLEARDEYGRPIITGDDLRRALSYAALGKPTEAEMQELMELMEMRMQGAQDAGEPTATNTGQGSGIGQRIGNAARRLTGRGRNTGESEQPTRRGR